MQGNLPIRFTVYCLVVYLAARRLVPPIFGPRPNFRTARMRKINLGCFPLCQRFRKFRSKLKWKGSFPFLLTGIFRITSGGGPHISVGIFWPKFAVPFLTNPFFALINSIKEIKMTRAISIGWPGLIGIYRSIFLRYSHWSLTGQFGIMENTLSLHRLHGDAENIT